MCVEMQFVMEKLARKHKDWHTSSSVHGIKATLDAFFASRLENSARCFQIGRRCDRIQLHRQTQTPHQEDKSPVRRENGESVEVCEIQ